ncbi:MAG: peptidase M14 [Bacteroidetes bacterium]|nr:peptidase M14 [Bacteroidota bacterium]
MLRILSVLVLAMILQTAEAQFSKRLYDTYDSYAFPGVSSRRFTHAELMTHLAALQQKLGPLMTMEQAGVSAENRPIQLLTLGRGPVKVLLWSQMHGDEPTATMALLDILHYIAQQKESPEVRTILAQTTLLIVPMLNPDGAQRFQRRTSQGIDMNRDALRLQTPEARILKGVRDRFQPEIGFNLHDQDPRYTVGDQGTVAVISLLAPAYNVEKSDNDVRTRAKQVASALTLVLEQFVKGHIAKYDDTFEPRAFGDNIQKWGTSVVLVESGGWKDDPEKMYIRKLNCVGLLSVFHAIATRSYVQTGTMPYERIPMNTRTLYDIIIRNATVVFPDGRAPVVADIAVNREEVRDGGNSTWRGRVVDFGDLSVFYGHEEWNGAGKTIEAASVELNDIIDLPLLRETIR